MPRSYLLRKQALGIHFRSRSQSPNAGGARAPKERQSQSDCCEGFDQLQNKSVTCADGWREAAKESCQYVKTAVLVEDSDTKNIGRKNLQYGKGANGACSLLGSGDRATFRIMASVV